MVILLVAQSSGVKRSAWGSSRDGTEARSAPGVPVRRSPPVVSVRRPLLPSLSSVLPPEGAQTFQLWVFMSVLFLARSLSPSSPPRSSSLRGVGGEVFQESSINVRAEEPRVRVSFHQAVNYLLSVVEAVHGGSLDVPFDLLSGVIVDVDLE